MTYEVKQNLGLSPYAATLFPEAPSPIKHNYYVDALSSKLTNLNHKER